MCTRPLQRALTAAIALLGLLGLPGQAWAHYLWVAMNSQAGQHGSANIYFEESPSPGDGQFLDPIIETNKTWLRTVQDLKPQPLTAKETTGPKQRWLAASLPAAAPRSVDSYAKFGVYRYGQTDALLHYYARNLDVETHQDLHELARAEQLDLDIVPHDHLDEMELTVLWKGQPATGRTVHIRGPKGLQQNLKTDDKGQVRFTIQAPGAYTFRTSVELQTPGREGDRPYSLIRHHATMAMTLPLKQ
jgi:hypothetical protein